MIRYVAVTEWIPVSPTLAQLESHADAKGRQLYLSPYDVPQAVRGYFDADSRRFRIEFKYIGDEPLVEQRVDDTLGLQLGRYSGRLYALEIDLESLRANSGATLRKIVQENVRKKLQQMASTGDEDNRDGYRLARELLLSHHAPAAAVFTPLEAR